MFYEVTLFASSSA